MWAQVHWLLLGNLSAPNAKDGKDATEKYAENYNSALLRARSLAEDRANTPTIQWLTNA